MKTYADTSFLVRIYLTFDTRQAALAKAAGMKVKPRTSSSNGAERG